MKIADTYIPGVPSYNKNQVLLYVLTQDEAGKYAAYYGIVPSVATEYDSAREVYASWVARNGTKIRYKDVGIAFGGITEEQYRH